MTLMDIQKVHTGVNPIRVYLKDGWRIDCFLKSKKAYRAVPTHCGFKRYKLFTPYEYENAEVLELHAGIASTLVVTVDLVAEQ